MHFRKIAILSALALLVPGLASAVAPASGVTPDWDIEADGNQYVNLDAVDPAKPQTFKKVEPNSVSYPKGPTGPRVEIYTSVGDNEGGFDWRSVNLFAYLVNSVPAEKQSFTTVFQTLHDAEVPSYKDGRWTAPNRSKVFAPTAAFINQANKYETQAERLKYIHVLGAKKNLDIAYDKKSSLARLLKAGYENKGEKAVDYLQCPKGSGGCINFVASANLMHSKYGAFEQAADSTGAIRDNVVYMTSSNLNSASGAAKSNVSIVVYDDKQGYDAISEGIYGAQRLIAKGTKTPAGAIKDTRADQFSFQDAITPDVSGTTIPGFPTESGARYYPSPRATKQVAGNDTLTKRTDVEAQFMLQQAANTATKGDACKVYLVQSLFNSSRGGVYDALADLAKQKCDIRVLLGNNRLEEIVDGYFSMSTDLRQVIDRVQFANVHDKTLSYKYGNTATTFGGSANLNSTSLDYDELTFRIDDAAATDAIQRHSERIYQLAKGSNTWKPPSSVSITPSSSATKPLTVRPGGSLPVATKVSPSNALVTNTAWKSESAAVRVHPQAGTITGVSPTTEPVKVTATISSPGVADKTATAYVVVSGEGTASAGGKTTVTTPPVLTIERYQAPPNKSTANGTTDIVATWGSVGQDYEGVVKLQYYSKGWKTYPTWVKTNKDGVGRITVPLSGSKTWRAYGARVDGIHDNRAGVPVLEGSTSKAKSIGYSFNLVRTKTPTYTPRLYAPPLGKANEQVPMLATWQKSGGTIRLQYKGYSSWKTYTSYKIPSGGGQVLFSIKSSNSKVWRVAGSTGKVSNSVKIIMK